jgi:hypothetical protein
MATKKAIKAEAGRNEEVFIDIKRRMMWERNR